MAEKTKKTSKTKIRKAPNIDFKNISYRDYESMRYFVTERAKILPRKRTGLSSKNQRRLTRAIKQARHLGLLPYHAEV